MALKQPNRQRDRIDFERAICGIRNGTAGCSFCVQKFVIGTFIGFTNRIDPGQNWMKKHLDARNTAWILGFRAVLKMGQHI